MKVSKLLLLALLGFLLFLSPIVRAQDDAADDGEDEIVHEEEIIEGEEELSDLGAVPVVETSVYFPDHQDRKFPIGAPVTMLLLVKNAGDEPFQLTGVAAHLHSIFDLNYYVQNFTGRELGYVVEPQREASIEYMFMPDKSLEPLEFHFSAFIEYNSTTGDVYRSTPVNGTVELYELPAQWDLQTVLSYTASTGVFTAIGYIVFINFFKPSKSSRSSRSSRAASAPSGKGSASTSSGPSNIDEWAGPIYKPKPTQQKKKSTSAKSH